MQRQSNFNLFVVGIFNIIGNNFLGGNFVLWAKPRKHTDLKALADRFLTILVVIGAQLL